MAGSSDQLKEALEIAQADKQEAKRLLAAGERVLTRVREDKNKLQDSNTLLGEELKDVRAQLADSVKENKRLRGGIFSMLSNLPPCNSARKGTDRFMSAGMLTGRPEEEMSGSSGDLLQELSQMHERARQAMRSVAKALWPSASPPGSMEELVQLFKGARRRFRLWKISACREGAREAWAMVKTRYTKLDPNHMARVGPRGSDGKEVPVSLVYDQVKVAAELSQQDCRLDSLLDGIEEEVFESK
jgi:hypothetical protein